MDNKKYSKIHGHNYKRFREKNCRTENKWKQNKINVNKLLLTSKVSCILSNLWKSMIHLKIHYIFVWVKTKVTLFPHITSIFWHILHPSCVVETLQWLIPSYQRSLGRLAIARPVVFLCTFIADFRRWMAISHLNFKWLFGTSTTA